MGLRASKVGPIQRMGVELAAMAKGLNYYPSLKVISALEGSRVRINGREFINFASNSYLNLEQCPRILEEAKKSLMKYGFGTGGSRITAGTQILHRQLEKRLARFKDTEDAVVFSAGYLANVGIIPALTGVTVKGVVFMLSGKTKLPSMEVFSDELVHASILDGLAVAASDIFKSGLKISRFANRNMDELEQLLIKSEAEHRLIIVEGVFSLHGRIAPLVDIVRLARNYGAEIYVDDAHGLGVLGKNGRGAAEAAGVENEIDFPVGTLSKALGACGGYITGSKDFCDYLRVAIRSYLYATSMSPVTAACLIAAIDVTDAEPWRRERVNLLSERVRRDLVNQGFDILGSESQIIPVCFKNADNAKAAAQKLEETFGIFAPPYYYPAVRPEESMIRVNITAGHTDDEIMHLMCAMGEVGKELGVI